MNARQCRIRRAPGRSASGCSGATATNVTPMIVSARVVNTLSSPSLTVRTSRTGTRTARPRCARSSSPASSAPARGQPSRSFCTCSSSSSAYLRDREVVARNLALLDDRTGAPAAAVDHLLVREHGLSIGSQLTTCVLRYAMPALQHLQEQPLVPAVVARDRRSRLRATSRTRIPWAQLRLHVRDVRARPLRRRDLLVDRRVLGRQAERVPPIGIMHVVARRAHERDTRRR